MSKYLTYYKIPDIRGKSVLEIGPTNGYFSFEFAKMGANVTIMDDYTELWMMN